MPRRTGKVVFLEKLEPPGAEIAARMGWRAMAQFGWAIVRSRDPVAYRAWIGRMAMAARTVPEADRRAVIESRLPVRTWPERRPGWSC